MPFGCALDTAGQYRGDALIEIGDSGDEYPDVSELEDVGEDYYVDAEDADRAEEFRVETADADGDYGEDSPDDGETTGPCVGNLPPRSFHLLSPAPDEAGVSTRTILQWGESIDPEGGPIEYTLTYDHDGNPLTPPLAVYHILENRYDLALVGPLPFGAAISWGVSATDSCGNVTEGISPRSFTTRAYPICSKIGSDVQISNGAGDSTYPSIAGNGSEFVAVWSDTREGHAQIYSRHILPSGVILDPEVNVSDDIGNSYYPSIASNGSGYEICYQDEDIYCRTMSLMGIPYGSTVPATDTDGNSVTPIIVPEGSGFGLVWRDSRDGNMEIYYNSISGDGSPSGSNVRLTCDIGASGWPSITSNGSGYGVSWHDNRPGNFEIYFKLISTAGVSISSDLRISNSIGSSELSSLAWSGSAYMVGWEDNREDSQFKIYVTFLSNTGATLLPEFVASSGTGEGRYPQSIWGGAEFVMVYQDGSSGNYEILLGRFSELGALIASMPITDDVAQSEHPRIVVTDTGYIVVWQDNRGDGRYKIYSANIDCEP